MPQGFKLRGHHHVDQEYGSQQGETQPLEGIGYILGLPGIQTETWSVIPMEEFAELADNVKC